MIEVYILSAMCHCVDPLFDISSEPHLMNRGAISFILGCYRSGENWCVRFKCLSINNRPNINNNNNGLLDKYEYIDRDGSLPHRLYCLNRRSIESAVR